MNYTNSFPNFLEDEKRFKSFEKISNAKALQNPFGQNSMFYTELKGDFFEGFVPIIPILWKLGAPMPDKQEKANKGLKLPKIIVQAQNKIEQKIFDYTKYSEDGQEAKNYWEYQGNNFAGQAILNKKMGYIDPEKLFFDKDGAGYNIYIPYKDDSKVSANNANIEYLKANAIIKLTQLDPDAFIIILSNLSNSKRKNYVNNILKQIVKGIERILQDSENIQAILDIPIDLLRLFQYKTIQKIFDELLKSEIIPWYREAILINILKVLPEKKDFNATAFLNNLAKPLDGGRNYFYKLYDHMNDWGGENNFSQLIIELTKIWTQSVYAKPDNEIFTKYDATTPIAYHQNYILGFRNDDFDFEFEGTTLKLIHNELGIPIPGTVRFQRHHIFQPLEVVNLDETEAENLKLSEGVMIPAFYLKAFDDKSAWENFEKAVWLAVDIISTFTGIGNLIKLRRLIQTEKTVYLIIKTTFGTIQVASGTISIGISLIENSKNKNLINKIREYLFWVEICTLGADILSTKILSKKAQEAQEALHAYRKTVRNEEELKQIDEFSDHLEEIADLDNLGKGVSGRGRRLGQRLSKSALNDLVNYLKREGVAFEIFPEKGAFEIKDFIGANGKNLIMQSATQAAFVYTNKSSKFCVREGVTVFEFLHEFIHFKHSRKLGLEKYHSLGGYGTAGELVKEKLVFDKMVEYKDFLTKKELERSLEYLNEDIYHIRGIDPISFDFDINKIPEVRKEIDIKQLFHLK